jgi:translocation and assembly module TamA
VRRRARDDVDRLTEALRSEGFYDATVDFEIQPASDEAPVAATLRVETGTVYLLARVEVTYDPPIPPERAGIPRGAQDLGLELGMRARAPEIQRAQGRLLTRLENHGYPDAGIVEREAVIDRQRTTMRVAWTVDPGAFTRFGDLELSGLSSVEAKYVRSFRTWEPGEVFDRRKVAALRDQLLETGLFDGLEVELGEPGADDRAPVQLALSEREHRTVGFGARYSTSTGPAGTAFWEHRNLLGQDEDLRVETEVGLIEQRLTALARKPRWNRDDQDLLGNLELRHKETEGFEETALETGAALERAFGDIWTGRLGGSVEALQTIDNEGTREFILFGLPGSVTRDSRDDPLNPTEGSRLSFDVTPYLATLEQTQPFVRGTIGGSTYYAIDKDARFVLAGRARLGTLVGAETEDVPASKRFYAGGGGSIRGFPFEEVGPLDADNDPLGGRSLVELGLELRIRITDTIGVVPFIDAGQVYDTVYPDLGQEEPLRYGAGLGLRYYTPIGPLRLDVAVPLNGREGVDNDFELYISLGQAF